MTTVGRLRLVLVWGLLATLAGWLIGCNHNAQRQAPPVEITEVRATSQTSIAVTFSGAVGPEAQRGDAYQVTAPDGGELKILTAYPTGDASVVNLATEPQQLVKYLLSTRDPGSLAFGGSTVATATEVGFEGSAVVAPALASAIALSNTEVLLTFADTDRPALIEMGHGATDPTQYSVTAPDLGILGAVHADGGADQAHVILTSTPMSDHDYTVEAANIVSKQDGRLLDPFLNHATFHGIASPDKRAPAVTGAAAVDETTVVVTFSEPLNRDAARLAAYVITDPDGRDVPITAGLLNRFRTELTLTTWPLTAEVPYELAVDGIEDANGNRIVPSTTGFLALPVGARDDSTPPRVLGANSTGNTSVVVTFSEPVAGGSYSAENPQNYGIVNAPAGGVAQQAVLVVQDVVLSANKRSVLLTTLSQSEIEYAVRVTDVKDLAGNQIAAPDRENPYPVTFLGSGASGGVDSDGDGLSDAAEQRGWAVVVKLANGDTSRRQVTSDPGDPRLPASDPVNVAARDTDQEGMPDADERAYLIDPRSVDTDGDQLTDEQELNHIYSDPAGQDSDEDGLLDGLEFDFFHTSPLFADTDGDSLDDAYEVATGNRDPRIADLPGPQIKIGTVDLALDVRFETETRRGESAVDAKSRAVSLVQDESSTTSTTDSRTNAWFFKAGAKVGFEAKFGADSIFGGGKITGEFSTEGGASGSSTFQVSNASARSSSRAYADTVSTENAFTRGETLSRHVEGAEIGVLVGVENLSNIAFTMTNLEITALVKDPRDPRIMKPIATLVANDPNLAINLGPLDTTARGPFRFVATDAFAARVEDLMRNPRGIVFEVANFNIVDEEGRNFAFGEQDANDRTAPLVIDYGVKIESDGQRLRGAVERYRVATSSDFDDHGRPNGITVAHALEDILGLHYYREEVTPTGSLSAEQIASSYSTFDTSGGVPTLWRVRGVAPSVSLTQVRQGAVSPQGWVVLLKSGIDTSVAVRDFVLQPENGLTLAFVQDLDQDGVPARVELYYGSNDDPAEVADATDSDGDGVRLASAADPAKGLSDNFEIYGGWIVSVNRGLGTAIDLDEFEVRSSPKLTDTDADGLTDWEEFKGCLDRDLDRQCDADTGFGIVVDQAGSVRRVTTASDATNPDTDGDRILDGTEVFGFTVTPTLSPAASVVTNPADVDTDDDGVADGDDVAFGGNPALPDIAAFTDTDGDGLLDREETDGWNVRFQAVSPLVGTPGALVTCTPTSFAACGVPPISNPGLGELDTDGDGLSDFEERQLGTHPRLQDTDRDGISDFDEAKGKVTLPFDDNVRITSPVDADTDDDRLLDGEEILDGWGVTLAGVTEQVYSDPSSPDADGDGLTDIDEKTATATSGTDPNQPDTDQDDTTDVVEVLRNRDAGTQNDTDPLQPDQLLTLGVMARGLTHINGLICGVISNGDAYFEGDLSLTLNGAAVDFSLGAYLGNNLESVGATTGIYQGGTITAKGENLRRRDGGPGGVAYSLVGFSQDIVPFAAAFDAIPSQVQKTFTARQVGATDDVCTLEVQFTLTPVMTAPSP